MHQHMYNPAINYYRHFRYGYSTTSSCCNYYMRYSVLKVLRQRVRRPS